MRRNIIRTIGLCKDYDLDGTKVPVLNDVRLLVQQGEMVSLMGPSGSGKTTLLNIVGGLDRPSDGSVVIDGTEITELNEGQLARMRRDKFGFIFQSYNLIPVLTAIENVELPCLVTGMPIAERRSKARELLDRVGLSHRMHHRPTQLSGGEQQRVSIARALMNNPVIVVADEPTGNVDGPTGRSIMALIQELNNERGVTFVIATHDPKVAEMADRALLVSQGHLVHHTV